MAWPLAIMGAGAGLGALGGFLGAKDASAPTWTKNDPQDQGLYDQWKGYMGQSLGNFGNLDFGPTNAQNWMFGNMGNTAFGPGGGGGGMDMSWQSNPKYRLGRFNYDKVGRQTKGINTDMTDLEKRYTDEGFLDVANDPYVQAQLAAIRGESDESMGRAIAQSITPESVAGTMGMSGAAMAAKGNIADDYNENLNQANAGYLSDQVQSRMGASLAANQTFSGREQNWDSNQMQGALGGYQSLNQAKTSMYNTDANAAYHQGALGLQGSQNKWNQQMDMWGMGEQMRQLGLQGAGLGAYGLYSDWGNQVNPWQQAFGKQTTQGPKVNPWTAGIQGMIAGGTKGLGMGKSLQGMGYFGGGNTG